MSRPRVALEVRVIAGMDAAVPGAERCVGALLHPTRDLIVGAIAGTPAGELPREKLSELIGLPWANRDERRRLERVCNLPKHMPLLGDGGS